MQVEKVSTVLRDLLIEHIDGPRNVPVPLVVIGTHNRMQSIGAAVSRGLLRFDRHSPPRQTFITERGREVLGAALGDWADALVRAAGSHDPMVERLALIHLREIGVLEPIG
jgi:hypothetical protein